MQEKNNLLSKLSIEPLNFKKKKVNYIFNIFLLFYLIIGFYFSINVGISTDEFIEQTNWKLNRDAIKDFFGYSNDGYANLFAYEWKFHGVGHHYFSRIYLLLVNLIFSFEQLTEETSNILLNHGFIFIVFFLSGIFAKKIVYVLIKDKFYSNIFLVFYLFYPYLLGHGFYNPKDIPFLCVWLIATYTSIKIFLNIYEKKNISLLNIVLISFLTSLLFSIRISGILILLQYFITFIITLSLIKEPFFEILKKYFYKIFIFIFLTLLMTFIFYPVFWKNPLLIFDSINQMGNISYGVCTLTLGKCMDSLDLPSSYILIWLFFKLPLMTLVGLCIFPFVEKKILSNPVRQIALGSILLSVISIIFLLIFFKANLYDELRHILFLVPLIVIVSFSNIYFFSKKLLLYGTFIFIVIFSIQNVNMYPYQYTWFNFFSNFQNINSNFELDYWGVSGKNIAKKINSNKELLSHKDKCIYTAPKHIIEPFISSEYNCIKPFFSIYPKSTEKYILVKYTRNLRRENPSNCDLIFEENYKLNLFYKNLKMGEVYICN